MKKLMLFVMLFLIPVISRAQEVTANTWASWANITSTQTDWTFPYPSRGVTIINGSTNPICMSFGNNAVISSACTDTQNDVFQFGPSMFTYIDNLRRNSVHIRIAGAASSASPVSVIVNY